MATMKLVPASGSPIEITKDAVLVGRDPSADLPLTDGSVSRKHARIEKRAEGWAVVDQGSANGTFIDSQRVGEAVLKHGQELRFGAVAFKVLLAEESESATILAAPIPSLTTAMPAVVPPPPPAAARPTPPPPPPAAPKPAAPPPAPAPKAAAPPPPAPPKAATPPPRPPVPPPPPRPPVPPRPSGTPKPPDGEKKKGPLFWGGVGCCGCLTVLLIVGGIVGAYFYFKKSPADAVKSELSDLRDGKIDAAYDLFAGTYKNRISRDQFEGFVNRNPALRTNSSVQFSEQLVVNDSAQLTGIVTSSTGAREDLKVELQKEEGRWKITLFEVWGRSSERIKALSERPV